MTIYVELDCEGSEGWKDWVTDNNLTYTGFHSFPMCGGIRLDGVSHYPDDKPEYIRYKPEGKE